MYLHLGAHSSVGYSEFTSVSVCQCGLVPGGLRA